MKKTIAIMLVLMCMVSMLFANGSSEVSASDNVDSWPSKPVNIVITSSAGGDGDYLMRLLGTYLEKELGQSLVITNLAGGESETPSQLNFMNVLRGEMRSLVET